MNYFYYSKWNGIMINKKIKILTNSIVIIEVTFCLSYKKPIYVEIQLSELSRPINI